MDLFKEGSRFIQDDRVRSVPPLLEDNFSSREQGNDEYHGGSTYRDGSVTSGGHGRCGEGAANDGGFRERQRGAVRRDPETVRTVPEAL